MQHSNRFAALRIEELDSWTWEETRHALIEKLGGWTREWGAPDEETVKTPKPIITATENSHVDLADLTEWQVKKPKKTKLTDGSSTRTASSSTRTASSTQTRSSTTAVSRLCRKQDIQVQITTSTGGTAAELWAHGTVTREQGFGGSMCGVVTATNAGVEGHRTFTFIENTKEHFVYKQLVYFTPIYKGIGRNGGWVAIVRKAIV